MNEFLSNAREFLTQEYVRDIAKAVLIIMGGFVVSRLFTRRLHLLGLHAQPTMVLRRLGSVLILVLSAAWALSELGLNLGVVLGAAGILTVAVGFAAQTSVSNLISGLFLMAERPFSIGDVIRVNDITGEVLFIGSISVKLRTFDNLLVRIPNEAVLKANVTNFTHFPIRRYDMQIGISYKEDIARVRKVLLDVAHRNPLCLEDPKPIIIFQAYGDSALELQFSFWTARDNWLPLRNTMHEDIKRAFDEHGIEIPFPQRTIHMAPPAEPQDRRAGLDPQVLSPEPDDSRPPEEPRETSQSR
jgi:small-conductance mechanosensitive channel